MKDYKKIIPNILTVSRLVLTPIIIIFGFFQQYTLVIILAIICALTDLFDGKLARKWQTVSDKGAKLDVIADKTFSIGLTLCLVKSVEKLLLPLFLEIGIGLFNLYYYYTKSHRNTVLMVGKFKTTALFISIIASMICIFYPKIIFLRDGFILATINLQILCLIFYFQHYYNYEDDKTLEKTKTVIKHPNKIYDYELEKTKKIDDLKKLV